MKVSEVFALRIDNALLKKDLAERELEVTLYAAATDARVFLFEYDYDVHERAFVKKMVPPIEPAPQTSPEALE